MNEAGLTWTAPEYEYRHKTISWYWLSILVSLAALAFAVWTKNFLFAVFILIAEILVMVWAHQKPADVLFILTEQTLSVGDNKEYSISDFDSFSLGEKDDYRELSLRYKSRFRFPLVVSVPSSLAERVRTALSRVMPETDPVHSVLDDIDKLIRF